MNAEEFLNQFAFAIEMDVAELSLDTDYKKLSIWDSLNALSVIAMADADFGVVLSGKDLESCITIGDLHRIAAGKLDGA